MNPPRRWPNFRGLFFCSSWMINMIDLEPCNILEVSSIVSTFLLSILRVFVFLHYDSMYIMYCSDCYVN